MMVPGMYSSLAGDLKRTFWPGGSSGRARTLCALLNWSCGAGMFDPMGVDLRSSRTVSRDFLAGKAAWRTVLIVLTCLLMKPLDIGKWEDKVGCAM